MLKWLLIGLVVAAGAARASHDICLRAVDLAAQNSGVPREVLLALARVETGRGANGDPWPWSINLEGRDHVFDSRAEALDFARNSLAAGRVSFDTGCFQINYRWHHQHFASLEEMFDPAANARYAARFLTQLYGEKGNWRDAAATYHSRTPRYAERYRAKFEAQLARLEADPGPPRLVQAAAENRFPLLQRKTGARAPGSLVPLANR